jgi:hypothetical protein
MGEHGAFLLNLVHTINLPETPQAARADSREGVRSGDAGLSCRALRRH